MKPITVVYTDADGTVTESAAFMYDAQLVLTVEGDEFYWRAFSKPQVLTPQERLLLDDHSDYKVLPMQAVEISPEELAELSVPEYVKRAMLERKNG